MCRNRWQWLCMRGNLWYKFAKLSSELAEVSLRNDLKNEL